MSKITAKQKDELKAAGKWQDFLRYRDKLKAEGISPKTARGMALDKMFSGGCDGSQSLPVCPPDLRGRSESEVADIRWVANNIDNPNPSAAECPSSNAWTLLRNCKQSESFAMLFIERIWTRLLPTGKNMAGIDTEDTADTVEIEQSLIERIRKIKERCERSFPSR